MFVVWLTLLIGHRNVDKIKLMIYLFNNISNESICYLDNYQLMFLKNL